MERDAQAHEHITVMRLVLGAAVLAMLSAYGTAEARGTARIQQPDGDVRTYRDVRITIANKQMSLTSADGVGTIVIERAGCASVDQMLRCHPYDAVLKQRGNTLPISIAEGTAWLNPSSASHVLPHSTTKIPPGGVVMSMRTVRGTYLSLSGTVDQMKK